MNLSKLLNIQKELDEHIVKEKGLEGQDLLDKKILALQVELGELANEHRGFKFWSEDQEPNDSGFEGCKACSEQGHISSLHDGEVFESECIVCNGYGEIYTGNRVLEEYVDCLHFILSIGNDIGAHNDIEIDYFIGIEGDVTNQLNILMSHIGRMYFNIIKGEGGYFTDYFAMEGIFIGLGKMLGFTWDEIEQAYLEKNKINHQRQENGY